MIKFIPVLIFCCLIVVKRIRVCGSDISDDYSSSVHNFSFTNYSVVDDNYNHNQSNSHHIKVNHLHTNHGINNNIINNNNNISIIDLIPFNGEPITKLRLNYLEQAVDLFILVEAAYTFTGIKKSFFYLDKYKHWYDFLIKMNKVLIVKIDSFPTHINQRDRIEFNKVIDGLTNVITPEKEMIWYREYYQRQYGLEVIARYFHHHHHHEGDQQHHHDHNDHKYILISSDADEIPKVEIVQKLRLIYKSLSDRPRSLEMLLFTYSFKWLKVHQLWYKAFVVNNKYIQSNKDNNNIINLSAIRNDIQLKTIKNAGWHCSNFMDAQELYRKMISFSHAKDKMMTSKIVNITWIQYAIKYGYDLYGRNDEWERSIIYNGKHGYPICPTCHIDINIED